MGTKVYMVHPKHGAMHVYAQWQAEDNLANGWKLADEPWAAPAVADDLEIIPLPPRRGRPPKS